MLRYALYFADSIESPNLVVLGEPGKKLMAQRVVHMQWAPSPPCVDRDRPGDPRTTLSEDQLQLPVLEPKNPSLGHQCQKASLAAWIALLISRIQPTMVEQTLQ